MSKKYVVEGEEVSLRPMKLKHWKALMALLKKLNVESLLNVGPNNLAIAAGSLIDQLFEQDLLKSFLLLILEIEEDLIEEIEDTVLLEILSDFFYSKKELTESTFGKLMKQPENLAISPQS